MKVTFTKNCSKNYMYIEDFENYDYLSDYKINMLTNNQLKHTLSFSYDITNNLPRFKYDITSKQSISSLFVSIPINYKAFTTLLLSLIELVSFLEEYLIDINSIVLAPEYIYMNPEKYTTYFAVCPGWQQDFYEELNKFLSDILKKIDHSDDALVLLAYRILCDVSKPGYNLSCMKESFLASLTKDSSIQSNNEYSPSTYSYIENTNQCSSYNINNSLNNINIQPNSLDVNGSFSNNRNFLNITNENADINRTDNSNINTNKSNAIKSNTIKSNTPKLNITKFNFVKPNVNIFAKSNTSNSTSKSNNLTNNIASTSTNNLTNNTTSKTTNNLTNNTTTATTKMNSDNLSSSNSNSNNENNTHNLSDNSLKMLISSRLFHNNKASRHNLYTISKSFYAKIAILSTIVLLLLFAAAYTYFSNSSSYQTSLILFVAGIAFLFGSIRYLMELYPSAKIPTFKGNLHINSSVSQKPTNVINSHTSKEPTNQLNSSDLFESTNLIKPSFSFESTSSIKPSYPFKSSDLISPSSSFESADSIKSTSSLETSSLVYMDNPDTSFESIDSVTSSSSNESSDYGETILLSELSTDNSHRLVYLGTDYSDDVKINTYPFTIGKLNSSVNHFINNPLISRLHASIQLENSDIYIEDLNSSNGTYLNGKLLEPHEKTILHTGDTLTFSHLNYMFK